MRSKMLQKMKFSIKDFFSKCNQIRRKQLYQQLLLSRREFKWINFIPAQNIRKRMVF